MDSDKTTLNESRPEHEAEYSEVLSELRDAVFQMRPTDVYQFCATYFDQKLAEQREGLLKIIDLNPGVLDVAAAPAAVSSSSRGAGAMPPSSSAVAVAAATGVRSSHQDEAPRESGPEEGDRQDGAPSQFQASEHAWSGSGSG
ncbi:hypothetical protein H4R19_002535, partial [Coemansia spiralis]